MSELDLLRVLLLASMAIGPLGTHRFLYPARWRYETASHVVAFACAMAGLFTPASGLTVVWLLYTATSFGRFLYARRAALRALRVITACVPFLFSNVAAVWLVGGANDLRILGYHEHFSYYAALHGNVLGWILLGSIAILVERDAPRRRIYVAAVLISLPSFLLIAFGIVQLRVLKLVGVLGLSIALPLAQLGFLSGAWRRSRAAFALGCISFAGLAYTMVIAWRNELAMPISLVAGFREIVAVHGVLNALVVAPCFLAAVSTAVRRPS